jgi:hypothetical protein
MASTTTSALLVAAVLSACSRVRYTVLGQPRLIRVRLIGGFGCVSRTNDDGMRRIGSKSNRETFSDIASSTKDGNAHTYYQDISIIKPPMMEKHLGGGAGLFS